MLYNIHVHQQFTFIVACNNYGPLDAHSLQKQTPHFLRGRAPREGNETFAFEAT